jgi:hypothetical protein
VKDREQRLAILFNLRPLMAMMRVFDREIVQTELALHRFELVFIRISQRDPDKTIGAADIAVNLADGNVSKLATVLIRDTVDQHGSILKWFKTFQPFKAFKALEDRIKQRIIGAVQFPVADLNCLNDWNVWNGSLSLFH